MRALPLVCANSGHILRCAVDSHGEKSIAILFWLSLEESEPVQRKGCELWTHLPRKDQPSYMGKNIAILFWLSLNGEPCVRASVCELWTHLPRKDQPVQRLKSGVESTGQLDDCRFEPPNPEPPTDPRRAWSRASRRPERSGAKPVVFWVLGGSHTQNNTKPLLGGFLG